MATSSSLSIPHVVRREARRLKVSDRPPYDAPRVLRATAVVRAAKRRHDCALGSIIFFPASIFTAKYTPICPISPQRTLYRAPAARCENYGRDVFTIERPPRASEGRRGGETYIVANRDIICRGGKSAMGGDERSARAATAAERGPGYPFEVP